ncbi:MAG TPA: integrase arm-type DNA-binding domain-containing protein, partial [Burkholderiaceae bacterium]|nr:integrase arm-type DNA-binding domain-containing protein [Burkholderiaceae bacterium]
MLTDAQCRNAKCPPDKKRQRFTDEKGLYLEVSPSGSKRWFWKYLKDGKEGRMALGSYPDVGLPAARRARDEAKLKKSEGLDPVLVRKVEKLKAINPSGDSVKAVALEWFDKQAPQWSEGHAKRARSQLERDLFPYLAERRMADVQPMELLAALRKVEERGAIETAHRGLILAGQVWRYAVATGRAGRDIAADLKGALTPFRGKHFAAVTEPAKLGELLRAIRGYQGTPPVRAALQLAPILMQRPGELRAADWAEMDLANALWTIPAARMKREKDGKENGEPHLVPLPRQAVEILLDLHRHTGTGPKVFPSQRKGGRPMSGGALRAALLSMGYTSEEQTWHGFRATARTLLAEELEFDPLVIEAQLAHSVKDANGRA